MPAASLTALLTRLIDYAGMYPPASLPLAQAAEKYRTHRMSVEQWILNRFVLPGTQLIDPDWRVTLLTDSEPGALPLQVETLETKQPKKFALPTYCEVPLDQVPAGAFAKIRTNTPGVEPLADFLWEAARRRTAFKATAGLHHPVKSTARGMHGFINVFTAAGFAWHGADRELILGILNEEDAHAFAFHANGVHWGAHSLTTSQIEHTRRDFAHSFGSCSFDEPIADLRELGWLA